MTHGEESIRTAIALQAGEWFIRYQAGPLSAGDSVAFLDWLKASPIHVEEYLGVARVAKGLRAAVGQPDVSLDRYLASLRRGDDTVVSLEQPAPDATSGVSRSSLSPIWQIAASLLLVASGMLWWAHDGELLGIPKTYRTAHGEQSAQLLPDGSVLRLDTDSAVTIRYSGKERVVDVKRGQALFEVAHSNGGRRFRVVAGDVGAIAVGTRFNVYRQESAIAITVAEGEVAVFTGTSAWSGNERDVPALGQRVTAGYQLRVDAGVMSAQPVPVDLRQSLGWLQHKIIFEHRPLGEVAAEFNRYARIPVEVEDVELRALPISGTFDADDLDSFIAYLEKLPGVKVERTPTRIRVMGVTPGT